MIFRKAGPEAVLGLCLGLVMPPFAYLFAARPILFFACLLIAVCLFPYSLHAPLLWIAFAAIVALHVAILLVRRTGPLKQSWYRTPIGLMMCLLMLTTGAALIRTTLLDVRLVTSGSMVPTIAVNDLVIGQKWTAPEIQRGRIYTLRFTGDQSVYVKRLVGLPGDVVTLRGNLLTLNGVLITHAMDEPEADAEGLWEEIDGNRYPVLDLYNIKKFRRDFHLGADEYFFLGDNRSNSIDSRIRGAISADNIIAQVEPFFSR